MSGLLWGVLLAGAGPIPACDASGVGLRVELDGLSVTARGDSLRLDSPSLLEAPSDPSVGGDLVVGGGAAWRLRRADGELPLTLPAWLDPTLSVKAIGETATHVWLVGSGLLAVIDLATGAVAASRLGGRPIPLTIGTVAELIVGAELWRCSVDARCEQHGRWGGPVGAAVVGARGVLLALGGRAPGLYRAARETPLVVSLVLDGDVVSLCGGPAGPAWALLRRGGDSRFVAVSPDTPAVAGLTAVELLSLAFLESPTADVEVATRVLERARLEHWPTLPVLALTALRDRRPALRGAAARGLAGEWSSRSLAGLWLASRDPDVEVRVAAMEATRAVCATGRAGSCRQTLGWFLPDADLEVSGGARDGLLVDEPQLALAGAPVDYRREAVARLISRAERQGLGTARRGLELLAQDDEPSIRELARRALDATSP